MYKEQRLQDPLKKTTIKTDLNCLKELCPQDFAKKKKQKVKVLKTTQFRNELKKKRFHLILKFQTQDLNN